MTPLRLGNTAVTAYRLGTATPAKIMLGTAEVATSYSAPVVTAGTAVLGTDIGLTGNQVAWSDNENYVCAWDGTSTRLYSWNTVGPAVTLRRTDTGFSTIANPYRSAWITGDTGVVSFLAGPVIRYRTLNTSTWTWTTVGSDLTFVSYGMALSPDQTVLVVGTNSGKGLRAFAFNTSTGIGSEYSAPGSDAPNISVAGNIGKIWWSPDGRSIIYDDSGNNGVNVIKWSPGVGFGSYVGSVFCGPIANGSSYSKAHNIIATVGTTGLPDKAYARWYDEANQVFIQTSDVRSPTVWLAGENIRPEHFNFHPTQPTVFYGHQTALGIGYNGYVNLNTSTMTWEPFQTDANLQVSSLFHTIEPLSGNWICASTGSVARFIPITVTS